MSRFMLSGLGVCALALSLGGIQGAAVAAPTCLTFMGLQHCPVDGATLTINDGQLVVSGAGGSGGVSIAIPGATAWRGDSQIELASGIGDVLRSAAIAHDVVTSTTEALRGANGTPLRATFTASSGTPMYTTLVYRDGQLQGSASNLPSGSVGAVLGFTLRWPAGEPEFEIVAGGRCAWTYRTVQGADLEVKLPDGRTLIGDAVRLVEDVDPQGAYPYATFERLVFQGNIQHVRFSSESVQ
jgi:hypothetical protein